jgi:hypothetical protein
MSSEWFWWFWCYGVGHDRYGTFLLLVHFPAWCVFSLVWSIETEDEAGVKQHLIGWACIAYVCTVIAQTLLLVPPFWQPSQVLANRRQQELERVEQATMSVRRLTLRATAMMREDLAHDGGAALPVEHQVEVAEAARKAREAARSAHIAVDEAESRRRPRRRSYRPWPAVLTRRAFVGCWRRQAWTRSWPRSAANVFRRLEMVARGR